MGASIIPNVALPSLSPQEYLRFERAAGEKHEYFAGNVRTFAGADYRHNLACANLKGIIGHQLRGKMCSIVGSDQRMQVLDGAAYVYPDAVVVCGTPHFNEAHQTDTLLNPTLLVEVLSPTTGQHDRSDKFVLYRQVPSLQQYLMLDSTTVHAELYTRDELGRWIFTETRDLMAVLDLGSICCAVPLAEVYGGVEF